MKIIIHLGPNRNRMSTLLFVSRFTYKLKNCRVQIFTDFSGYLIKSVILKIWVSCETSEVSPCSTTAYTVVRKTYAIRTLLCGKICGISFRI